MEQNDFISTSFDRVIHNTQLMGTAKTKKFLKFLIMKGLVGTEQHYFSPYVHSTEEHQKTTNKQAYDYYVALCTIIDSYQEKFGDDWDVFFTKYYNYENESNGGCYYIINFFTIKDKVVIKNYSNNTQHIIRGLIVSNTLGYNGSSIWFPAMSGGRLQYTQEEAQLPYRHSHLHMLSNIALTNYSQITTFCTGGSGTDVNDLNSELTIDGITTEMYVLYLYAQDSVIECESNVGIPYVRYNQLGAKRSLNSMRTPGRSPFTAILDKIQSQPFLVDFYVKNNNYSIHLNSKFNAFIKKLLLQDSSTVWKSILCKKLDRSYYSFEELENENSLSKDVIISHSINDEKPYIIYRGQKRYFEIFKSQNKSSTVEELKPQDFIIHPNFLEYVHKQLESKLQRKAVAFSAIRAYYSRNNVPRNLRQDRVLV